MRMRSPPFVPVKSNSKFHPLSLSLSLSLSSSSHSPFELGLGFRIRFFSLSKLPIKSRFDFSTSISMATSLALSKIERAHQMYRVGNHGEALGLYTEALAMAKTRAQKIALHSNRAACYLKLHDFNEAAEECTAVLELDRQHTGALMLRAQTLVTLKEYQSALFDVNRLMELNPSSDVYRNLQSRLKTQLSLAPIPESEEESLYPEEEEKEKENDRLTGNKKSEDPNISPKAPASLAQNLEPLSDVLPKGWEAIPKPKGHSGLDYSRWDNVENDSSEEEDNEEEEHQPQYRFRVRTVGVRPVK